MSFTNISFPSPPYHHGNDTANNNSSHQQSQQQGSSSATSPLTNPLADNNYSNNYSQQQQQQQDNENDSNNTYHHQHPAFSSYAVNPLGSITNNNITSSTMTGSQQHQQQLQQEQENNHSIRCCRVCGDYFTGNNPAVILVGCGCSICTNCSADAAMSQQEQEQNYSSPTTNSNYYGTSTFLMCPLCSIETFLPIQNSLVAKAEQQQEELNKNNLSSTSAAAKSKNIVDHNNATTTTTPFNMSQQIDNYNRERHSHLVSEIPRMLPRNYELSNSTSSNSPYPLCDIHEGMPRGFYCPSHSVACCARCISEQHRDCPFRACEVKDARPILLQQLTHTRRILETSLDRTNHVKDNLLARHSEKEQELFDNHCGAIYSWMEKCMQLGQQAIFDSHQVFCRRQEHISSSKKHLYETQRQIHGLLRALDVSDQLPATSLIDAMPILKTTMSVPDVSVKEGSLPGIDLTQQQQNQNNNNNNSPSSSSFFAENNNNKNLSAVGLNSTFLPRMEALYGERILVSDQGLSLFASASSSSGAATGDNNNETSNANNNSGASLALVDLETKTVVARILDQNDNNINSQNNNKNNKLLESNKSLKSPNGICEIITEIEIEDKSAAAGIAAQFSNNITASSSAAVKQNNNSFVDPMNEYDTDSNFFKIQVGNEFDADNNTNDTNDTSEQQQQQNDETSQTNKNNKRTTVQFEYPKRKILRREFAICDTLNSRIVCVDAMSGNVTREIRQKIRGSCINNFSPYGICSVPVLLENQNNNNNNVFQQQQQQQQEKLLSPTSSTTTTKTAALLVTDVDNHRVYMIDAETGDFLRFWGNFRGNSKDEFWSPLGITQVRRRATFSSSNQQTSNNLAGGVGDTLFCICDSGNHRLSFIDILHSGVLFVIDLFRTNNPTSTRADNEFHRFFPASVCCIPDHTTSTPDQEHPMLSHEEIELAVTCKLPTEERGDCVILVNFSFDLLKVERTPEQLLKDVFQQSGSTFKNKNNSNNPDNIKSSSSNNELTTESLLLESSGAASSYFNKQGGGIQKSTQQLEIESQLAMSAAKGRSVAYQLSKMRSKPPRTIFQAPSSSSGSTSSKNRNFNNLISQNYNPNSNTSGGRYAEAVFSMLNSEWGRTMSTLERLNADRAIAPCSLTVTTTQAMTAGMLSPSSKWTEQLFEDSRGVAASSVVLVISDRNSRCLWLIDPVSGRIHDRVDGRIDTDPHRRKQYQQSRQQQQQQKSSNNLMSPSRYENSSTNYDNDENDDSNLFFSAPSFVFRVSPSTTIASQQHQLEMAAQQEFEEATRRQQHHQQNSPSSFQPKNIHPQQTSPSPIRNDNNNNISSSQGLTVAEFSPSSMNEQIRQRNLLQQQQQQSQQEEIPTTTSTTIRPQDLDPKTRLLRYYYKWNPSKVPTVDVTLKSFVGKEEDLFRSLVFLHGAEPTENVSNPSEIVSMDYRSRIYRIYNKYDSRKIESGAVELQLSHFKGAEEELIATLVSKYGKEPLVDETDVVAFYRSSDGTHNNNKKKNILLRAPEPLLDNINNNNNSSSNSNINNTTSAATTTNEAASSSSSSTFSSSPPPAVSYTEAAPSLMSTSLPIAEVQQQQHHQQQQISQQQQQISQQQHQQQETPSTISTSSHPSVEQQLSQAEEKMYQRLDHFYSVKNPAKGSAENLLRAVKQYTPEREEELFAALEKRYGKMEEVNQQQQQISHQQQQQQISHQQQQPSYQTTSVSVSNNNNNNDVSSNNNNTNVASSAVSSNNNNNNVTTDVPTATTSSFTVPVTSSSTSETTRKKEEEPDKSESTTSSASAPSSSTTTTTTTTNEKEKEKEKEKESSTSAAPSTTTTTSSSSSASSSAAATTNKMTTIPSGAVNKYNSADKERLSKRLKNFYSKYAPSKISMLEKALQQDISEGELLKKMCANNGQIDPEKEISEARAAGLWPDKNESTSSSTSAPSSSTTTTATNEKEKENEKESSTSAAPSSTTTTTTTTSSSSASASSAAAATANKMTTIPSGAVNKYNSADKERLSKRLKNFYSKYAPSKISMLEKALQQDISEAELLKKMCANNGQIDPEKEIAEARAAGLWPDKSESTSSSASAPSSSSTTTTATNEKEKENEKESSTSAAPSSSTTTSSSSASAAAATTNKMTTIPSGAVNKYNSADKERLSKRLKNFYSKYAPSKISMLEKALQQDISEAELLKKMCANNGQIDPEKEISEARAAGLWPDKNESTSSSASAPSSSTTTTTTTTTNEKEKESSTSAAPSNTTTTATTSSSSASAAAAATKTNKMTTIPSGAVNKYNSADKERLSKRLKNFYSKYAPSKISMLEKALQQDISEAELLKKMCANNGQIDPEKEISEARAAGLWPDKSVTAKATTGANRPPGKSVAKTASPKPTAKK